MTGTAVSSEISLPPERRLGARTGTVLVISLLLVACGGGSSGDSDGEGSSFADSPDASGTADGGAAGGASEGGAVSAGSGADAAGLDERPSLAGFALSLDGAGDEGGYRLVEAYPALDIFHEALRAAPVPGERRMLVVEQGGRIKVFEDDPGVSETRTVLDISPRVTFSSEQGLLGFAFDPRFAQNRFVYLCYTRSGPGRSVLSRMRWDAATDTIDPSSERTLLEVAQPFTGHNGATLEFGPDGYLYLSLGDGGDGGDPLGHAQNLASLLGKVLRLDVHPDDPDAPYDVPADNPFLGVPDARPEIYALGLRNPYRFTFDRQSGELWLGDVGQNDLEEIDVIEAGGNYGWPVYEGTRPYNPSSTTLPDSAFTPPVHEYAHDEGLAVIGGYVYRGDELGSLFGRYLYADFVSGTVWALEREGEEVVNEAIARIESPTGFAETSTGEVLVISRYEGLFRFEPVASAASAMPDKLSATGLFVDPGSLTPMEGLIEYRPAHPFWSDGTGKRRWLGVPDDARIGFGEEDWTFPLGTVAVKHFEIETIEGDPSSRRRLETRVLLHTRAGWRGYAYHWDADQADATLANERRTETLTIELASGGQRRQRYEYPSRADCSACHTRVEGYLLGLTTAQLNSAFDYPGGAANQLETFAHIGLLDRDIGEAGAYAAFAPLGDADAGVAERARAYLDVNCSACHQPGGSAPVGIDLRAGVPLADMNVVDVAPAAGDLGIAGARIIAPGERRSSVLWERLRRTDDARMPPLSTHVIDEAAVQLIGEWIDHEL